MNKNTFELLSIIIPFTVILIAAIRLAIVFGPKEIEKKPKFKPME